MPLYEYECDACGRRFEVIQKFSDPAPEACRHCGKGPVHRQASSPAIQFKGTGWYITDYAQKGKSDSSTLVDKLVRRRHTDGAPSSDSSSTARATGRLASADKSDGKSDGGKSDAKSDRRATAPRATPAASSPKPSTGGTSKESKE